MKIIEPKVEEIKDFEGVDNFYKAVARAARICYASDKTTNDKELVERLIQSKHFSPFEHAVIYIDTNKFGIDFQDNYVLNKITNNKYCITNYDIKKKRDISFINGRILVEAMVNTSLPIDKNIEYFDHILCGIKHYEVTDCPSIFKSFIVDTSIGCTRELNRHHNDFYICEQSTRYCDFSKDKFGNEVAFNKPYWYDTKSDVYKHWWEGAMKNAEMLYMAAIKNIPNDLKDCSNNEFGMGFLTDEARGILPLDTHTRAIYTATIEEWQHIIDLRLKGTTGKPHGDIKIITEKINNLINGI